MVNGYPTVFDCQVDACKEFFRQGKFPLPTPYLKTDNGRPIYDITGFNALQVIAVLSAIVNYRDQFKMSKTFYLLIRNTLNETTQAGFEEFFRLTARPTKHQPGNGIVVLRPRGKQRFTEPAKSYAALNGALEAFYYDRYDIYGRLISGTTIFASHTQQLLKNNEQTNYLPQFFNLFGKLNSEQTDYLEHLRQTTMEVYMILLFEIARRLVKLDNPTEMKEEFDVLPIGSAIARLLKLLQFNRCTFEDVFFPGRRFHCFTGTPAKRRIAIDKINNAIFEMTGQNTLTIEDLKNELQEMFTTVGQPIMISTPMSQSTSISTPVGHPTLMSHIMSQSTLNRNPMSQPPLMSNPMSQPPLMYLVTL